MPSSYGVGTYGNALNTYGDMSNIAFDADIDISIHQDISFNADIDIFAADEAVSINYPQFSMVEGCMIKLFGASLVRTYISNDNGVTFVDATDITKEPYPSNDLNQNLVSNPYFISNLNPRVATVDWSWQNIQAVTPGGAAQLRILSNTPDNMRNDYNIASQTSLRGGTFAASVLMKYDSDVGMLVQGGTSKLQILYRDSTMDEVVIVNWATDLTSSWKRYFKTIDADPTKEIARVRILHSNPGWNFVDTDPYGNPTLFVYVDSEIIAMDKMNSDTIYKSVQFPDLGRDIRIKFEFYDPKSVLAGYRIINLYNTR